jgi:hypothetical protein
MSRPEDRQTSNAPGQYGNQGPKGESASPTAPGPEERHQTARERVPSDQERQGAGLPPGGSTASPPGPVEASPSDTEREERIRRRAYQIWEEGGRQHGQSDQDWSRAAEDLDREDAELQRSGSAGKSTSQSRT